MTSNTPTPNRWHQNRWIGHGLYLLIMAVLIGGIYVSGQRINYSWHWERLYPFIIDTTPVDILADADGTAVLSTTGELSIVPDNGDEPQLVPHYDTALVMDGDLVFQGNTVAQLKHWRFGPIAEGLWVTIKISVVSLVFAIVLGVVFGLMRISEVVVLRDLAITYIELIRGTPLLVQIFIVYFFIGTVFQLDQFTAAVAALAIFTGAYVAEIVRAGIQSIPVGQMEAARSLGMNYVQAMYYVIMPQAIQRTLPPLAGQFINLIKDSSLVSVISITDLSKAGREVISGSFAPFEVWFTVALLYLLITGLLSLLTQRLEKRMSANV